MIYVGAWEHRRTTDRKPERGQGRPSGLGNLRSLEAKEAGPGREEPGWGGASGKRVGSGS